MPYKRKFVATYKSTTPMRPPDWRWHRVCEIVDEGSYATERYDGELICRGVSFVRKMQRLRSERGVRNLTKQSPDIVMAMKLSQEFGLRPLEVMARVLARQSNLAIARLVGSTESIVATYVDLFFDVRSRLDARSWITLKVAGVDPRYTPCPQSLLLLDAYLRGPFVIEPWLDYLVHQGESHDLRTEEGRRRAATELLINIHQLPDTQSTRNSMVKHLDVFANLDMKPAPDATAAGAVARNSHRFLADFSWAGRAKAVTAPHRNFKEGARRAPNQENWRSARAG